MHAAMTMSFSGFLSPDTLDEDRKCVFAFWVLDAGEAMMASGPMSAPCLQGRRRSAIGFAMSLGRLLLVCPTA